MSVSAGHAVAPLRVRAPAALPWWAPLVPAALLMVWGFLRLRIGALTPGSGYQLVATTHLAWSDIISIYGRDYFAGHPFPYTTNHPFEYPVLTGIVFYLAGFAGYTPDATPAFAVNYLLLALAGLALVALLARRPGTNPWLLALSPSLVLYTGANWDLLALLPGVASLLLFEQRPDRPWSLQRDALATVLLALSVWLKFFAIIWLPIVLVERARRGQWRACALIVALFCALSVAINLPFALLNRSEWGRFFTFNRVRDIEVNLWTIIRDWHLSTDTVNTLSALGVLLGLAALAAVQWRRDDDCTIAAAAAILIWFFFLNKVFSPQYFIWIVPFVALLNAPLWLAVALAFVDVIYYTASFQILHLLCPCSDGNLQTFSSWDFDHVLMPAMELRELVFLGVLAWIGLCVLRVRAARSR